MQGEIVKLLDFGLSMEYLNENGKHKMYGGNNHVRGTPHYASMEALRGMFSSRRDDLESLGYSLMDIIAPEKVPWAKTIEFPEILNLKKIFITSPESAIPFEFVGIHRYLNQVI